MYFSDNMNRLLRNKILYG